MPLNLQAESLDYTPPLLLCNAVTSTGDCTATGIPIGFATSKLFCHVSVTGTAPTSVTVKILGSADNTTFSALTDNHVYTIADDDTASFHINKPSIRYLKGNFVSKVGGDATTAVTIKCVAGGN